MIFTAFLIIFMTIIVFCSGLIDYLIFSIRFKKKLKAEPKFAVA